MAHLAGWDLPFQVAKTVVNRLPGVAFTATPKHAGNSWGALEISHSFFQPTLLDFTVAIYELDESATWAVTLHLRKSGIACTSRCKRPSRVQLNHTRAHCFGHCNGTVDRARIHIDDERGAPEYRPKACTEALTLVSANDNNGQFLEQHRYCT
jgi:hypothetical protein